MNINRKYIIIFGTLILLLVFITGAITYYNEKKEEQTQIPDVEQSTLSSSQYNPTSPEALSYFINYCKNAVLSSDLEEFKNKEIKEGICTIEQELRELALEDNTVLVGTYIPSVLSLDSIISFKPDKYIGIVVDLKDVVREYDPSLLEEEKLYFCSISEPSWEDQLYLQIAPKQNLFFPEGGVCCGEIKVEGTHITYFSGFVPQAEFLNIKQYLVDEQTVSDAMNMQSFSEIKEILKDYPIIWQMEKPITP